MKSFLTRIEKLESQPKKLSRLYIVDEDDTPNVEAEVKRIHTEHPSAKILIITDEK